MIAAIARAARNGILIKGGLYLELLAKVDVVVFDKTGTLTANKPVVVAVTVHDEAFTDAEMVRLAAAADRRSAHPLARAVVAHAATLKLDVPEPQAFEAVQARGVKATVEGRAVLVGNPALLKEAGVTVPELPTSDGQTPCTWRWTAASSASWVSPTRCAPAHAKPWPVSRPAASSAS